MGHTQNDTYSSMYNKSDNVNVDETFVRKSVLVHVLKYTQKSPIYAIISDDRFLLSSDR